MAHHTGLADPPTGRDVWRDTKVVRFADARLCVVTLVGTRRDPPRGPRPVYQRQRHVGVEKPVAVLAEGAGIPHRQIVSRAVV